MVNGGMSLNIKNEDTNRLAHELAGLTGESLTTAVTVQSENDLIGCSRAGGGPCLTDS
jgi:Rv0623-like transcription factor